MRRKFGSALEAKRQEWALSSKETVPVVSPALLVKFVIFVDIQDLTKKGPTPPLRLLVCFWGFSSSQFYSRHRRLDVPKQLAWNALNPARAGIAALFPEVVISAYSNEDLFHQDALLDATASAIRGILHASRELVPILVIGAPLRLEGKLFNCALAIYRGRIFGITPRRICRTIVSSTRNANSPLAAMPSCAR